MNFLPHELITMIGSHLLPKWRLRLFLCRKEWTRECAETQRALFDWHMRMKDNLNYIGEIKYDIIDINSVEAVSKRVLPNNKIIYSARCLVEEIFSNGRGNTCSLYAISSQLSYFQYMPEMGIGRRIYYIYEDIDVLQQGWHYLQSLYLLHYIRKMFGGSYKIYRALEYISMYLDDPNEILKLYFAFGKIYYVIYTGLKML
jgi:hypothetical protein